MSLQQGKPLGPHTHRQELVCMYVYLCMLCMPVMQCYAMFAILRYLISCHVMYGHDDSTYCLAEDVEIHMYARYCS